MATIMQLEIEVGPVNNVFKVDVEPRSDDKCYIAMHVIRSLTNNNFYSAFDVNGDIYVRLTKLEHVEKLCKKKHDTFDLKYVSFHRVEEVIQLPENEDVAITKYITPLDDLSEDDDEVTSPLKRSREEQSLFMSLNKSGATKITRHPISDVCSLYLSPWNYATDMFSFRIMLSVSFVLKNQALHFSDLTICIL